jgi:hypothetical protein
VEHPQMLPAVLRGIDGHIGIPMIRMQQDIQLLAEW